MKNAFEIRKGFEEHNINRKALKELYQEYNNIENIDLFLDRAEKMFPKLNCGLTSVYLKNKLGGRVVNGKYKSQNHTFLLLNKKIVDITADQYGGPKVYIGPLQKPWSI